MSPDCPARPPVNYVSAGTITITAPSPANAISMAPNADNTYDQTALAGYLGGDELMHVSATGSTVPAFSVDLSVPRVLLIDSPTTDTDGVVQVSASSDLVIQFSRGAAGVELYARSIDGAFVCRSAPGASSMTITKGAMAAIGSLANLSLWTLHRKDVAVGDFTVSAAVALNAYTPDKQHPVVVQIR